MSKLLFSLTFILFFIHTFNILVQIINQILDLFYNYYQRKLNFNVILVQRRDQEQSLDQDPSKKRELEEQEQDHDQDRDLNPDQGRNLPPGKFFDNFNILFHITKFYCP